MKKILLVLSLVLSLVLVGCSSNQPLKKFMSSYYKYVETCQVEEIALNSDSLDYYYQDCTRMIPYVDTDFRFIKIDRDNQDFHVLVENKTSKQHVLWTVREKDGKYLVISFEFK